MNPQIILNTSVDAAFGRQYHLQDRSRYDLSYAQGMTVTAYTQAFSGYYSSQDFECNGADCRYNSFAEGDSA